jgi:hypothetical protein
MKGSIVNQVRDAIRDAGGDISDTDHGWTADIDDVLQRRHRLEVTYTSLDGGGLGADVMLRTADHARQITEIAHDDECINLTSEVDALRMCITTGNWPLIDVSMLAGAR